LLSFLFFNMLSMIPLISMAMDVKKVVPRSHHGVALGFLATSSNSGRIVALLVLGSSYQIGISSRYSTLFVLALLFSVFLYSMILTLLQWKLSKNIVATPNEPSVAVDGNNSNITQSSISGSTHDVKQQHPLENKSLVQALKYFVRSPQFWLGILVSVLSASSNEIFSFLPLYIAASRNTTVGIGSLSSLSFTFGAVLSIFTVGIIEDKMERYSNGRRVLYGFLLTVGCLLGLSLLISSKKPLWIALTLMFLFGICIAPSAYVAFNLFLIDFAGGHYAGTLYSINDSCGSLFGRVIFDLGQSIVIENAGWNFFWLISIIIIALTDVFVFLFLFANSRALSTTTVPPPSLAQEATTPKK